MTKLLAMIAVCTLPMAAQAVPYPEAHPTGYDPYAVDAIERADYATAEDRLMRRLSEDESDVSAMLNLAAVMMETNRAARASSMLEQVLETENVQLGHADGGAIWSHDAATAGLRGRVTVGSR
ncbi:tetratricopeptide repeat protein [Parasphingopyxis algicola]|uniref:tetratricopeptide repeat protein n=1 Tax=Parasphingopyxis algicola TaxID=2026624 RepID=UPI0015A2E245|nr:tetratricopeptide repeat protein [Parasphingopyxis algicola]QLC24557.1 tetratricopeptide repeat protein [Parasphingopyxis algicola]